MDWSGFWQTTKNELYRQDFANSTLHLYHRVLRAFLTFAARHPDPSLRACRPADVTAPLVKAFLHHVNNKQPSWSWLATHTSVIRTAFDKLARCTVTAGIRTPKRPVHLPEVLSAGEVTRLIESAPTLRDRLMIGLLYGCGMRAGELCNVRWRDVDIQRRALTVTFNRGSSRRELSIPEALVAVMILGVQQCPGEDYVFAGVERGKPLSQRVIERHISAIANRSGIQKTVTCGTLRHSYAVACLRAGMTVEELRQSLGHVHIRSTLVYQRCMLPAGVVSPADRLTLTTSNPDPIAIEPRPADAFPVCPSISSKPLEPITLPFPAVSSGPSDFLAMMKTRILGRFLAVRNYFSTA